MKSIILTDNQILAALPHATNPRTFRYVADVALSMIGTATKEGYVGGRGWQCFKDEASGHVDLPVVVFDKKDAKRTKPLVVRGCGRFGTIQHLLKSEDAATKTAIMAIIKDGISVYDGTGLPESQLLAIANDNDSLKTPWDRVANFRQYIKVRDGGMKPEAAARAIGYSNRLHVFEWLYTDCCKDVRDAWINGQIDPANHPRITDNQVKDIAKAARDALDADKTCNPFKSEGYTAAKDEALSGKPQSKPKPVPPGEFQKAVKYLGTLQGSITCEDAARLLWASRGIGKNNSTVAADYLGKLCKAIGTKLEAEAQAAKRKTA